MTAFAGFPAETIDFLADLRANNDRDWFAANKQRYERAMRVPADAFVAAMQPALEALIGRPVTPRLFRIHRDLRFSRDKSPYHAHLHIGFSAGAAGFFFGLEPEGLHCGAGSFAFEGAALDRYRSAVADPSEGARLATMLDALEGQGFRLDPLELKRVPPPYAADHPRAALLRRKGLAAWRQVDDRATIESAALMPATLEIFSTLLPLAAWIERAIG